MDGFRNAIALWVNIYDIFDWSNLMMSLWMHNAVYEHMISESIY